MVLATRERWFVDGVLALGTLVQFMPSTCLFRCSLLRYAGTWVHRRTSFRLLRHAMLAAALISALVLHTRITDHVWDRGHSTVRLIIVVVVVVFIGKRLR